MTTLNLPSPAELVECRAVSLESAVLWARLKIAVVLKSDAIDESARRNLELLYADLDSAIELVRKHERQGEAS